MSEQTSIEWCHHTFNPWWGCQEAGPGCDHCYARGMAERFYPKQQLWGVGSSRMVFTSGFGKSEDPDPKHWNAPLAWNKKAQRDGVRRRVFCLSMGDWADNHPVATEQRVHLWPLIKRTPWLDWLLLTKRIGNARAMLPADWGDGYPNVWLGATVVDQAEADRDIPKLLATPARVRFLSIEPMLGPVDLATIHNTTSLGEGQPYLHPLSGCVSDGHGDVCSVERIDWVIAGGESGPKARPAHPDWLRSLRDKCAAAGVAFMLKQWGEWLPVHPTGAAIDGCGATPEREPAFRFAHGHHFTKVGKKAAGRLLDGVQHDEFPNTQRRAA